jgi:hypothetical protein
MWSSSELDLNGTMPWHHVQLSHSFLSAIARPAELATVQRCNGATARRAPRERVLHGPACATSTGPASIRRLQSSSTSRWVFDQFLGAGLLCSPYLPIWWGFSSSLVP